MDQCVLMAKERTSESRKWCQCRQKGFHRPQLCRAYAPLPFIRAACCGLANMSLLVGHSVVYSGVACLIIDHPCRFLGALTNDSRKLANFTGFYKGVQSAGGAVSFRINTLAVSSVNELVACWILPAASLLIAAPTIIARIRDKVE